VIFFYKKSKRPAAYRRLASLTLKAGEKLRSADK
jgi:hypothetical protein